MKTTLLLLASVLVLASCSKGSGASPSYTCTCGLEWGGRDSTLYFSYGSVSAGVASNQCSAEINQLTITYSVQFTGCRLE